MLPMEVQVQAVMVLDLVPDLVLDSTWVVVVAFLVATMVAI